MEAEDVEPSTVPPPTPLTWAQIVKQKKKQPEEVKEKKEKITESREQKMQAEVNQQLPDKVKKFPTPTPLTGCEIMEAKEAEPSTVPTPTPLTSAQIVKQKKKQPEEVTEKKENITESREQKMQAEVNQQLPDKVKKFPTPTPLTGCEIMEAKEAEPSTVPTPTPLTSAQIVKQKKKQPEEVTEKKENITESREQKMQAEVNQQLPDKVKKFPTPTPLTGCEIMEAKEAEPSTVPTPTPLTSAQIVKQKKKQPEEVTEKKENIMESREQKMQAEVNQQLPDKVKKFPTPTPLTRCEIMEAKEAEPSTVPTPTPLTSAQIVKQKKKQPEEVKEKKEKITESREQKMQAEVNQQLPDKVKKFPTPIPPTGAEIMEAKEAEPSTVPTPTTLTGGEIVDEEEAEPSTPPTPTPLTWAEIVKQNTKQPEEVEEKKEKIKESREQKMQAEVSQQLPDKMKKLPMESHHRKNNKSVELFIRNLDYSLDDKRLYKEFLQFGAVISAKVVMENGCSKGFGFVSYSTSTEAMEAIKGMNGKILGRRLVYVALSKSREEHKPFLTQTEQKTWSSRPTNPRQSKHKDTQRENTFECNNMI
ncbi:proteoglycan 4-like isoform X2 [Ictalurus furcatus]|uniref:proteoglycan 4-like isoform X2 n=1 Tax=Ictalurus furcatus TaxID=66913 RepID=UPI0023507966|nr:proteoglycan 4-like isoform X2 [Ictalurus furcatus]